MPNRTGANASRLPELIFYAVVALALLGVVLNGVALSELRRIWEHMLARPSGPLSFRFIVQPLVCCALATRDGLADARTGRSPYFWTVLADPAQRLERLREGLAATAKILIVALALDVAYQLIEFKTIYPLEALVVALCLGFMPYLLVRGPVTRIAHLATALQRSKHGLERRDG